MVELELRVYGRALGYMVELGVYGRARGRLRAGVELGVKLRLELGVYIRGRAKARAGGIW